MKKFEFETYAVYQVKGSDPIEKAEVFIGEDRFAKPERGGLIVETVEGLKIVGAGDYLIRNEQGDLFVRKPSEF